jgi:hypothetical protein
MPPTRSCPRSSTRRSGPEPRPAVAGLLALALALAACAPGPLPPPGDDAWCASRFEQLDAIDFGPRPAMTGGFDFRQSLIAQIHQGRCLTFGNDIAGLEALGARLAPHAPPGGPAFGRPVAVQAGVVTSDADAGRARAFFEGLGYRARTQGSPRLGTRVLVEARTAGQVEDILAIAAQAGFVGAFPSRYVGF